MTRFWLKLDCAIELVFTAIENMLGGELYVKKIPSMKMIDLASAVAPDLKLKEVGIRPGEKVHEMMISEEDGRHTLEFDSYYIIQPDFDWWHIRNLHKDGKPVPVDFKYHSGNNSEWLSVEQMKALIEELD
jgi:UDP-N-acetylglucosamine 4,6-dehydratase